jgi:putative chitinase
MEPVREAYWLSVAAQKAWATKMYDIQGARPAKARELGNLTPGDGFKYAGRGYVQLTGRVNYDKAERALGIPLTASPDLAMVQTHAAAIMRRGMEEGWFTTKALSLYLPAKATLGQFTQARRVINGQDRAEEIAGFALTYQAALEAGGWR